MIFHYIFISYIFALFFALFVNYTHNNYKPMTERTIKGYKLIIIFSPISMPFITALFTYWLFEYLLKKDDKQS
jgi:hypothetical protein